MFNYTENKARRAFYGIEAMTGGVLVGGTYAKSPMAAHLQKGDVILEIDWQGARQIRQMMPDAINIFVLPPSLQALHQRLTHRGQDDEKIIQRRMQSAQEEMRHYNEYQYIIINDVFETALEELHALIITHRLSLKYQKAAQQSLIDALIS